MTQPARPVLGVFAHPDDEALCAGGTLALCAERGRPVQLLCATRGELGPISDPRLATRETLAAVRERELRASCAELGIDDVQLLDLPDACVAWAAHPGGAPAALVRAIRSLRPSLLLTFGPDGLYGHSDHVAVSELVQEARALAADPQFELDSPQPRAAEPYHVPRVFHAVFTARMVEDMLAALASTGRAAHFWELPSTSFPVCEADISASVDVTSVLDRKLRALRCHRTQLAADNALALLEGELAVRFLGVEHFRCADGLPGNPLDA